MWRDSAITQNLNMISSTVDARMLTGRQTNKTDNANISKCILLFKCCKCLYSEAIWVEFDPYLLRWTLDPPVRVEEKNDFHGILKLYVPCLCVFFVKHWWLNSKFKVSESVFPPHLPGFPYRQTPAGLWRIMGGNKKVPRDVSVWSLNVWLTL